eukprot:TRINITY_DN2907_c0_g1_i1.p1 TRINITY_DN2907_c0_g1~~TRINITY_DN2907_c0_g1_i1.p1  ORF type:complete len:127 (+),score=1.79 TRINITY_DN2907_c0_g1_i1:1189-1569(+)
MHALSSQPWRMATAPSISIQELGEMFGRVGGKVNFGVIKQTVHVQCSGDHWIVSLQGVSYPARIAAVTSPEVVAPAADILFCNDNWRLRCILGGLSTYGQWKGLTGQVIIGRKEGRMWEQLDASML